MNKKITDLSNLNMGELRQEIFMPVSTNTGNKKLSLDEMTEKIKKRLGFVDNPMRKCKHCGQWGAVYCACRHCGAPID